MWEICANTGPQAEPERCRVMVIADSNRPEAIDSSAVAFFVQSCLQSKQRLCLPSSPFTWHGVSLIHVGSSHRFRCMTLLAEGWQEKGSEG